jgi:hypothetical protein
MKLDAKSMLPSLLRKGCLSLLCLVATAAMAGETKKPAASKPRTFPSATEAVQAFEDALHADDAAAIVAIFGKGAEDLIETGDQVQDKGRWSNFVALYDQKHDLDTTTKDRAVLVIGNEAWPFPIPLVKTAEGWFFDEKEGREEIINRRIGRNELSAIQTCLAIADAQREYSLHDHDGDGILEYASKFHSTEGKQDGLSWRTAPGEPLSPLGDLLASATAEGYARNTTGEPKPYHGYYFKLLTTQGKSAPGGAYDYMVRGNMIGGFALLAYPATYRVSGVMSFMLNQDGVVYQRDPGPESSSKAQKMASFNPDASWSKVPAENLNPFPPEP